MFKEELENYSMASFWAGALLAIGSILYMWLNGTNVILFFAGSFISFIFFVLCITLDRLSMDQHNMHINYSIGSSAAGVLFIFTAMTYWYYGAPDKGILYANYAVIILCFALSFMYWRISKKHED